MYYFKQAPFKLMKGKILVNMASLWLPMAWLMFDCSVAQPQQVCVPFSEKKSMKSTQKKINLIFYTISLALKDWKMYIFLNSITSRRRILEHSLNRPEPFLFLPGRSIHLSVYLLYSLYVTCCVLLSFVLVIKMFCH